MMANNTMNLSKLKSVYSIRNKTTGELYVTPNGKTSWSTKSAAKNAWNCHNFKDIQYTNYKGESAIRHGNARFDDDAVDLEVVEMAYVIAKDSDADNELKYLKWFYANADFGPADSDVRYYMNKQYIYEGGVIPDGYKGYEDE
jgi:hypothetical protein